MYVVGGYRQAGQQVQKQGSQRGSKDQATAGNVIWQDQRVCVSPGP